MNFVESFCNQQIGSSTYCKYDMGINRLACKKSEEFRWLFPEYGEGVTDTPIFACKFAQVKGYEHILALANEEGKIAICNTETGGPRFGGGAHNNAIFDLAWMPKKMKLVSASGDHTAAMFDFRNGDIVVERLFQGHTRSLKTVACRVNDSFVFATGGRDGKIIVWDSRCFECDVLYCEPEICLPYTHYHHSLTKKLKRNGKIQPALSGCSSVTGLVFQDSDTLISCGAGDGFIKVWDLRKSYVISDRPALPKYTIPYSGNTLRNGFSNLLLNSNGTRLYANCLDNIIYCYNVATYNPEPVMKYYGHKNHTFYVKSSLSSDEMYLFSGSSDNNAYVWNVSDPEPIVKLEGHEAEVTCVAWCARNDDTVLVTCSDDLRHRIWRIGPEIIPEGVNTEYSSWAKVKLKDHNDCTRRASCKRVREPDENSYPFAISCDSLKLRSRELESTEDNCACPKRPSRYLEEISIEERIDDEKGKDMRREEKNKRLRIEQNRKRKYLNDVDLNAASINECSDDSDDNMVSTKRVKFAEHAYHIKEDISPTNSNLPKSNHSEGTEASANECTDDDDHRILSAKRIKFDKHILNSHIKDNISSPTNNSSNLYAEDLNEASTNECTDDSDNDDSVKRVSSKRLKFDEHVYNTEEYINSPTSNLPNFVVDGCAPHLNNSPVKKVEKDWLTKLRMERLLTSDIQELSKPTSSKLLKTDGKSSLSKNTTPTKSPHHKTGKKLQSDTNGLTQSHLLKFFKVTSNSGPQYGIKSPNLVISPKLTQSTQEN